MLSTMSVSVCLISLCTWSAVSVLMIVGDLLGIKVGHGADDFEAGEDVILTLKDGKVLGEDGMSRFCSLPVPAPLTWTEDELQNVNMADNEALKEAKERKRRAQAQYTGLDDDEFDEDRIGIKADILGKYDDSFTSGKTKIEVRYVLFPFRWFHLADQPGLPFRCPYRAESSGG